ncbi:hypothetical protein V1505DRAFT_376055 [Lipomyces doorenjongii]
MRGVLVRAGTAILLVASVVKAIEPSAAEPAQTETEVICPSDGWQCYPAVFEATDCWQEVLPDQVIPGGLHVRLNFETGRREAKLLSNDNSEDNFGVVVVSEGGSAEVTRNEQDQGDEQSAAVGRGVWGQSSYSHKPNPHISLSEHEEFENNLAFILSSFKFDRTEVSEPIVAKKDDGLSGSSALQSVESNLDDGEHELLIAAMKNVEDFSHEIDFGIKLAVPEVISVFMTLVNKHSSPSVRALSARIIGSSLRNNGPALQIAVTSQVVTNLLESLDQEHDPTVRSRIMFALASSIHGKFGRREFWEHKGGDILRKYFFSEIPDEDYMGRCGTLVEDSFVNEMMNSHSPYGPSDATQSELKLELGLWCSAFQDALSNDNIVSMDVREKIFSALSAIKSRYPTYCPIQDNFRQWIAMKVEQRTALRRQKHEAQEGLSSSLSAVDGQRSDLDTIPGQEMVFLDKLSTVRHSLFGNPKAGRKALDNYHDEL